MELKALRYFYEVAKKGNFTVAASALNLSQPTLSKQILELEDELAHPLLVRGKRKTVLTEAGRRLFKTAGEVIELLERAKKDINASANDISGDVYIAGGESKTMNLFAKAMKIARERYPEIRFHIFSGNAEAVAYRLERGLADFGAFVLPAPIEQFEYINLPMNDRWGLLMRKDHNLAERDYISPSDFSGLPVLCSAQNNTLNEIEGWLKDANVSLNIIGTYTLLYNAALMVKEGLGVALCLDGIADVSASSKLCFKKLMPELDVTMSIAWKKGTEFTTAAAVFHNIIYNEIINYKKQK